MSISVGQTSSPSCIPQINLDDCTPATPFFMRNTDHSFQPIGGRALPTSPNPASNQPFPSFPPCPGCRLLSNKHAKTPPLGRRRLVPPTPLRRKCLLKKWVAPPSLVPPTSVLCPSHPCSTHHHHPYVCASRPHVPQSSVPQAHKKANRRLRGYSRYQMKSLEVSRFWMSGRTAAYYPQPGLSARHILEASVVLLLCERQYLIH